jgi:outer membrane protein TolC
VHLVLADSLTQMPISANTNESEALNAALHNRKDLQAVGLQKLAAQQQAAAIRSERLPTVDVVATQGQVGRNGRSYLPTYDWGLEFSLPVFDGFRREGRVEEQTAVARDYANRERDLRIQVEADVKVALLNLASSAEAAVAARERLQLAELEVQQARERFQAGVAGNADVITASLTLNIARTDEVNALSSYQAARIALARARGSVTSLE